MTGAEHYSKAEQLLDRAQRAAVELHQERAELDQWQITLPTLLASAQVHATLALAAASATTFLEHYVEQAADWSKALGLPAEAPS